MKNKTVNTGYMVFLAVVAAIGGILFGYDTAVISGTTKAVRTQFGLSVMQQGWYVGCALIGSIFGVLTAGVMSDNLGRKKTMLIASVLFSISAIGCCLCKGFTDLVVFRIIGGIGIGIVSIVSPMYISEVSVAEKRGTMVSLYQLAITVGFVAAYFINYFILADVPGPAAAAFGQKIFHTEYWRGMLGFETLPDLLFLIVIFFIPESPRWLMVKGRNDEAMNILNRIYTDPEEALKQKEATLSSLRTEVKGDWHALFEPGIFGAVIIGSSIAILGQFMGVNAVLYYGPSILEQAGFGGEESLLSQSLVGVVNMLTTVIALLIIDKVGRKKLIYWGVSGMIICLLAIALYFKFGESLGLGNSFVLIFFLLYIFCQAISISAVVFVILSEMYPNNVRGLAMSIAGLALWLGTYLIGQLTPWMLENLSPAGTFLLFAAMCIPYMLIFWKMIPETTGKSLEEIESYWRTKGSRKKK